MTASSSTPSGHPKVVIVDDQPLVLEGIAAILKFERDIEIVGTACDTDAALNLIMRHQPHLLITDVNMPFDVFTFVKQSQRFCPHLKIIMVTGYDTESNLEMAMNAGIGGFVRKTDGSKELMHAIKEVLAGRQYFSAPVRERLEEMRSRVSSDDGLKARHRSLSPREIEVLKLVAQGMQAKAIAKQLHISVKTVDRHKSNIMMKLDLHNQVDLTRYAIREGLISP